MHKSQLIRAARSLKTQLRHKTTTATTHCSCEHNKENSREKPCRTKQHSESDREECCEESSNVPSLGFGGARGVCVCLWQVVLGTKRQCVRRAQTLPGVTTPPLSSTKHSLGKPDPKANKSRKKEGKNIGGLGVRMETTARHSRHAAGGRASD